MNSAATAEAKIAPLVPLFMTFSIFRSAESLRLGGYRRESRDAGASVTLDNDSYSALRRKSYTAAYDGLKNARCGNFCGVEGYFSELKEAPAQNVQLQIPRRAGGENSGTARVVRMARRAAGPAVRGLLLS